MNMVIQALPFDPATLNGLSEKLLLSHHQNNYGAAVKRLNSIRARLRQMSFSTTPGFELNGLKREELMASNSMFLHELYFACLGGAGSVMAPAMALALSASFSSVERWQEEFVAMSKALGGGSGWVVLCFQPRDGSLVNQWAPDHAHALAGSVPILALDLYEHAYHMDFGAQAGAYVDAFMLNLDWAQVYQRYQLAVNGAGDALGVAQAELADRLAGIELIDVRRAGVFEQAGHLLPGASWRDPGAVSQWASELPREREVVVYCVYGHEVGRSTAMRLRAQGINARFLLGGIDAWQAAQLPLVQKNAKSAGNTLGAST